MNDLELLKLRRRNRWYLLIGSACLLAAILVHPLGRYISQDILKLHTWSYAQSERSIRPHTPLETQLKREYLSSMLERHAGVMNIYRDRVLLVSVVFFLCGFFLIGMFIRTARHFGFPFKPEEDERRLFRRKR